MDVRSTVPAEEVARLRYSPLPEMVSIFSSPLTDSALTKMPAAGSWSAGSSSTGAAQASSSSASRPAQKQSSTSPSGQSGKKGMSSKGKAPFSSSSGGSGHSRGKEKGAGKKST